MSTVDQLSPSLRRAYEANIRRFYIQKFLVNVQLWFPIWVLYLQRERGLSLTQITALDAPFWLVIVFCEVPTGALADRWGRRLSMLLGGMSFGLAIFLFGIATSYWWILFSYLVWGVSMTLTSGADTAFVYDTLAALGRESEFARVIGRARACDIGAGLLGALAGAPLAAATSLSFPILVSSGLAVLATLVVLTFREPVHRETGPRLPYVQTMTEALRYILHHAPLRSMVALNAVLAGAGMAGFIFTQPFLAQFEVPVAQFGLLTAPSRLFSIAGSLLAYRMAARFGERNLLFGLGAGFTGALLVLGSVPSVAAFSMFPLLSFCNATLTPITNDYVNRNSPPYLRATLASVSTMASSVMLAAFEPLLGYAADRGSLQTTFLIAAGVVAVLGSGALVAWTVAARTAGRGVHEHEQVAAGVE